MKKIQKQNIEEEQKQKGRTVFQKRFQELLIASGLKKKEFARRVRLSPSQISQYLEGHNKPRGASLYTVCNLSGVTVSEDWLLGKTDRGGPGERYVNVEKEDRETIKIFEELLKSNDDQILDFLRRELPRQKEFMELRRRAKA